MSQRQKAAVYSNTSTRHHLSHDADSYGSLSSGPSSPRLPSAKSGFRPSEGSLSQPPSLQLSSRASGSSLSRSIPKYPRKEKEDLSPSTSLFPRSSTETYSSLASTDDLADSDSEDVLDFTESYIPQLPPYQHEIEEFNVRPSSPDEFSTLFPSLDRLSIRHDDFTSDGNMNLRVETTIPGRRKETIQLFHLRMHDLTRRDFSLRRYCRSSGREVCSSKRQYVDTTNPSRPFLQRSMSHAFQSLAARPKARRMSTAASIRSARSTKSRPGTGYSTSETLDNDFVNVFDQDPTSEKKAKPLLKPTNTIKLEFSNYARVDLARRSTRSSKKYQFDWWGHDYAWKRVVDRHTNALSFHLVRDGNKTAPVAHIVAETRSPNQVMTDEYAGGWVPPCHMWISDQSIVDATTDIADVVISTGLVALVDDCIKDRWPKNKRPECSTNAQTKNTRSFVQNLFTRRSSDNGPSPLRFQRAAAMGP